MTTTDIFVVILGLGILAVFLIVVRILSKHINRLYGEITQLVQESHRLRKDVEEIPGVLKKQFTEEKKTLTGVLEKQAREAEQKTKQALESVSEKEKTFHKKLTDFEKTQQKLMRGVEKRTIRLEARLKGVRFAKPKPRKPRVKKATAEPVAKAAAKTVARIVAEKARIKPARAARAPKKARRGRRGRPKKKK